MTDTPTFRTITSWWSATDRLFITQLLDEEGYQVGDALFAGNAPDACRDVRWLYSEWPLARLDVSSGVRRELRRAHIIYVEV